MGCDFSYLGRMALHPAYWATPLEVVDFVGGITGCLLGLYSCKMDCISTCVAEFFQNIQLNDKI